MNDLDRELNRAREEHRLLHRRVADLSRRQRGMSAEDFNRKVPVGTEVRYYLIMGDDEYEYTKTRSEAWVLGDGISVVVRLERHTGGMSINHLTWTDGGAIK